MLSAGVLSLLEEMISKSSSYGCATALYLNLSCLEEAKTLIGSGPAVQFLINLLQANTEVQCKQDSLHALYNLSTVPSNIPNLLSSGIISGLVSLLAGKGDKILTEKCIAVLTNLAASHLAKDEMVSAPGLIGALATKLDSDELLEQEQAVSCLVVLCNKNEKCSHMVLREGVIPALVSMSVNGTSRAREKAKKLLMLFREHRQRDPSPAKTRFCPTTEETTTTSSSSINNNNTNSNNSNNHNNNLPKPIIPDTKPLCKSMSRRIIEKPFKFFWKSRSYSFYQV